MKKSNKLATFIFTEKDVAISPYLTTIPEYGRWLMTQFDDYTCTHELRIPRKCKGTMDIVMEYHPGTRIGQFFDNKEFKNPRLYSWTINQDSAMMQKLINMGLANLKDANNQIGGDSNRILRLYTIEQIEFYIKTKLDKNFIIGDKIIEPKKIALRRCDMKNITIPSVTHQPKALFNTNDSEVVEMTVKEIEKKLGHKVSIIS